MQYPSPFAVDYASPAASIGLLRRALPSWCFYPGIARIVWNASRAARRGRLDDAAWVETSIAVGRLLESVGMRLHIENTAAVANLSGPAVIIGNHMSTLETFLLPSIICAHRPVTFVVKRELVEAPVFKHVMRSRAPVVVGRDNPRNDLRAVLEDGAARLQAGISVIVFPQTTRAAVWTPAEFNTIGVKLARRAAVPVVPLALQTDAWGLGRWLKDCGRIRPERPVRLAFGDPLPAAGGGRDAHQAVVRFITEKLQAWGVPFAERQEAAEQREAQA